MPDDERLTPPQLHDSEATARSVVLAATSAIPLAGSPLAVMIESLWIDPYRERVADFLVDVADRLENLHVRVDEIADRELLETIAMRAARAAALTHEAEKLRMLRNAVVNTALGVEPDQVWSLLLVDMVDELTEAHLVTLAFLNDLPSSFRLRGLSDSRPGMTRDDYVAELLGTDDNELVKRLLRDLDQRELAFNVGSLQMPGHGTSDAGKRLLRFITDPIPTR
jgi:hypothetical protein